VKRAFDVEPEFMDLAGHPVLSREWMIDPATRRCPTCEWVSHAIVDEPRA